MTTRVVIDTDPGTDDALALAMALASSDLSVQALTTVGGNASLAYTTRNALRILEYLDRTDVPVYRGAARPIRGRFTHAHYFHGPAGLAGRLRAPVSRPASLRAVDYLTRFSKDAHLVALGPLTNVARAMARSPRIPFSKIVVMGGAVQVGGNVTPHAEFNIFNDPHAANAVLSSGVPTVLIGLDVCNEVYVERRDRDWPSGKSRGAALARRLMTNWFRTHPEDEKFHLCDPLAMLAAVAPELFTFRCASVRVETEIPGRLGQTVGTFGEGPVEVAIHVRAAEAKRLIADLLAR